MKASICFSDARNQWSMESPISKGLIIASLFLVIMAYLPTLLLDYFPEDQSRAFRYSVLSQTPYQRAKECVKMITPFYVRTGRPLVWIGECIEHAAVNRIQDFKFLRPFNLALVLLTVLYLGATIAPIIGGLGMGVVAISLFVFAPGYSFMYFQGLTSAMVLLCLIIATASFSRLNLWLDRTKEEKIRWLEKIPIAPLLLFIGACMIYPAWAFIVIPLGWIYFGFDTNKPVGQRVQRFAITISFYFLASIIYYLIIKILIKVDFLGSAKLPNLGPYEVSMLLNPSILLGKLIFLIDTFFKLNIINLSFGHGIYVIILGIFSIFMASQISQRKSCNIFSLSTIYFSICIFLVGIIILTSSISPWIFSNKKDLTNLSYVLPWNLFFCVSLVVLGRIILIKTSTISKNIILAFFIIFILFPLSAVQNELSFLEIAASQIDIETIRTSVDNWLDNKGYVNSRLLLVVDPKQPMPAFIYQSFHDDEGVDINLRLSTAGDPEGSIPWVFNAIFRERTDHPVGRSIDIVDCHFDQKCAEENLAMGKIVLLQTYGGSNRIRVSEKPFIINLSLLTVKPVSPFIELVPKTNIPTIIASSQLSNYGPQGLIYSSEPGWHAESPPKYPESLIIDFNRTKEIRILKMLYQNGMPERGPRSISIYISNNGRFWIPIENFNNICKVNEKDGWHVLKFSHASKTRYLKIEILSNCGDPQLLTLRGLKFE
ncbi:MAG: discoidin domain-containing protein [Leptospirales bacterium]